MMQIYDKQTGKAYALSRVGDLLRSLFPDEEIDVVHLCCDDTGWYFYFRSLTGSVWAEETLNPSRFTILPDNCVPKSTVRKCYEEIMSSEQHGLPCGIGSAIEPSNVRSAFTQLLPELAKDNDNG